MVQAADAGCHGQLNEANSVRFEHSADFLNGCCRVFAAEVLDDAIRECDVERASSEWKSACVPHHEISFDSQLIGESLGRENCAQARVDADRNVAFVGRCYTPSTPIAAYVQQRVIVVVATGSRKLGIGYSGRLPTNPLYAIPFVAVTR